MHKNLVLKEILKDPHLKDFILVILGPSASGKTFLSLKLASNLQTSILSADSRQVYKHLDYSTGKIKKGDTFKYTKKPFRWVINNINYWGYDVIEPNKAFSAGDFVSFTQEVTSKEIKPPIIVGGTGLYIKSIFGGLNLSLPLANKRKRAELEKKSVLELQAILKKRGFPVSSLNPSDLMNKRRLIRKIELMDFKKVSNKTFSLEDFYNKKAFYVYLERKSYNDLIEEWIVENFKFIEKEVNWLLKKYPQSPLFEGFIFKEFKLFLQGSLTYSSTVQQIATSYLKYIKRQKTYFKKYFPNAKKFIID